MTAKVSVALFIFSILPSSFALCQRSAQHETFPVESWIVNSTHDSVSTCFSYSIPFSRMIFEKGVSGGTQLKSDLSFSLDAVDSTTGAAYHAFKQKEFQADNFTATCGLSRRAIDFVLLTLPRSTYEIAIEVRDETQHITYIHENRVKRYSGWASSRIISTFFLDSVSDNRLYPTSVSRTIPFPGSFNLAILVKGESSMPLSLQLLSEKGDVVCRVDSIIPWKERLEPRLSDSLLYFVKEFDPICSLYLTAFHIDTLEPGKYRIREEIGSSATEERMSYTWLNEPLTLRNFDTALPLLKYVTSDSLYAYLSSGSNKEVREKFRLYWKAQDPTPMTAYNELEAEFYRRADYAVEHFRTITTNNGANTDRGKSYILYGPPSRVKRDFRTDGTYETWDYPHLERRLIFKGENPGDFLLYETEKL